LRIRQRHFLLISLNLDAGHCLGIWRFSQLPKPRNATIGLGNHVGEIKNALKNEKTDSLRSDMAVMITSYCLVQLNVILPFEPDFMRCYQFGAM
jgi:hypothetical protein